MKELNSNIVSVAENMMLNWKITPGKTAGTTANSELEEIPWGGTLK